MKITLQANFNLAWQSFVVEKNPKAWTKDPDDEESDGYCAYRGDGGAKCGFGLAIPDDLYHPEMEGKTAALVIEKWPDVGDLMEGPAHGFDELQRCHDEAALDDDFHASVEINLRRFAKDFNLIIPEGQ